MLAGSETLNGGNYIVNRNVLPSTHIWALGISQSFTKGLEAAYSHLAAIKLHLGMLIGIYILVLEGLSSSPNTSIDDIVFYQVSQS